MTNIFAAGCCYFNLDSLETVSFLRPFARRLANTFLPLAVSIRLRNPCTDLRRRLCGWNVRFITFYLPLLNTGLNRAYFNTQQATIPTVL